MNDTPEPEVDGDATTLQPMSQAEQVLAFKNELDALIGRYTDEFDLEPETILGAMLCQIHVNLSEMTMCYIATMIDPGGEAEDDEDDEDEPEGEEWKK